MKELTCIVCPNGCRIRCEKSDDAYIVTGNSCRRGEEYAISEMTRPMRTLCTTVRTAFPEAPALPVRTGAPIPKERVFDVMKALSAIRVDKRFALGDVIISNILGLNSDILCTSNVLTERNEP